MWSALNELPIILHYAPMRREITTADSDRFNQYKESTKNRPFCQAQWSVVYNVEIMYPTLGGNDGYKWNNASLLLPGAKNAVILWCNHKLLESSPFLCLEGITDAYFWSAWCDIGSYFQPTEMPSHLLTDNKYTLSYI